MFTYKDIQWVRNVKRSSGEDWAYFDVSDEEMMLHWSSAYKNQPTHAMKPLLGDIVVLFQKINETNQIYFTHLLTPVDLVEHDCIAINHKHRWGRKMKVLARTKEILKPASFDLTPVNQGHTYDVQLMNKRADRVAIQQLLWSRFQPYLNTEVMNTYIEEVSGLVAGTDEDMSGAEGTWKENMHKYRERNNSLVYKKKNEALRKGKLFCECCNFDFSKAYPTVGSGFIECHHKIPIHQGARITSIDDLALVCANCHRMLHRKNIKDEYYTVEALKEIITHEYHYH